MLFPFPRQACTNWQVALRAVCALEAMLQAGSSQAAGEVSIMFQSDPDLLRILATSDNAPLRDKAAWVLKLLVGEDMSATLSAQAAAAAAASQARPAAAPAAAAFDLLGGLDSPAAPAPRPAAAAAAAASRPAAATSPLDLLGDLDVPSSVPSAQVGSEGLLGSSPAGGGDMFGGLTVASGGSPGALAAPPGLAPPPRPAAPAQPAPLDDLLGSFSPVPAAAPAAPAPAAWPPAAVAAPRPGGAAAFDFLGMPTPTPAQTLMGAPVAGGAQGYMQPAYGGVASMPFAAPAVASQPAQQAAGLAAGMGGLQLRDAPVCPGPAGAGGVKKSVAGPADMFDFVAAEFGKK